MFDLLSGGGTGAPIEDLAPLADAQLQHGGRLLLDVRGLSDGDRLKAALDARWVRRLQWSEHQKRRRSKIGAPDRLSHLCIAGPRCRSLSPNPGCPEAVASPQRRPPGQVSAGEARNCTGWSPGRLATEIVDAQGAEVTLPPLTLTWYPVG